MVQLARIYQCYTPGSSDGPWDGECSRCITHSSVASVEIAELVQPAPLAIVQQARSGATAKLYDPDPSSSASCLQHHGTAIFHMQTVSSKLIGTVHVQRACPASTVQQIRQFDVPASAVILMLQ